MGTRSDLSGGISLRFTAAMERARELAERPYTEGRPAPLPQPVRRVRVVGDAQTSLERFFAILDAHELLAVDGYLADDVQLISVGDHFDYPVHDGSDPRHEGLALLRWLAEHAPTQAPILFGNHDAARVMELIDVSDDDFARLRAAAAELDGPGAATRWAALTRVPTPGLVRRDYASFTEAQRRLVQTLLRAGRYRLGVAVLLADGRDALVTHAGVTRREVELLGVPVEPRALAAALDRHLREAVGARRDEWAAGRPAPLDLRPLHTAGEAPNEGGGLLYHRPSNPDRDPIPADPVDRAWETDARRRRFHPRELPRGLVQVAGHTSHRKARLELRPWLSEAAHAAEHGALRTLIVDGERVIYDLGITGAGGEVAVLHMVDASMNEPDLEPDHYPMLEVAAITG